MAISDERPANPRIALDVAMTLADESRAKSAPRIGPPTGAKPAPEIPYQPHSACSRFVGDGGMLLSWHIRYIDRQDREFKDRDLLLDTSSLDSVTKAAVELAYELNQSGSSRDILKYRKLFRRETLEPNDERLRVEGQGIGQVWLDEYFEDEHGDEVTRQQVVEIMAAREDVSAIPSGARQHDIDYMLAPGAPIKVADIVIDDRTFKILGYFVKDLREMEASALLREGPGRLTWSEGAEPVLQTAVSDDEIGSFVMVFRRLYMQKEPASFCSAVDEFARIAGNYPLAQWVLGEKRQYEAEMDKNVRLRGVPGHGEMPFPRKRLIDVFLYTRYAHQPDDRRSRQFRECLDAVGNRRQLLTWMYLGELYGASLQMLNGGRVIARVYDGYCELHGRKPNLLDSVRKETPGIGQLETKGATRARLIEAKVVALAEDIWRASGMPAGGPTQFKEAARAHLDASTTDTDA